MLAEQEEEPKCQMLAEQEEEPKCQMLAEQEEEPKCQMLAEQEEEPKCQMLAEQDEEPKWPKRQVLVKEQEKPKWPKCHNTADQTTWQEEEPIGQAPEEEPKGPKDQGEQKWQIVHLVQDGQCAQEPELILAARAILRVRPWQHFLDSPPCQKQVKPFGFSLAPTAPCNQQ